MSTVEEIVAAVKGLSPEKRNEVRRKLRLLWPVNSRELASGVQKPRASYESYWSDRNKSSSFPIKRARPRRPPIKIKGKPISETVVEDRR